VHCPSCHADDTKVVDSRLAEEGSAVRRRRQCLSCSYRFTTFERLEEAPSLVVKSDGSTQPFDRDKIAHGVRAASKGRGVSEEQIERLATEVEEALRLSGGEITTSRIGLAVLDHLRLLDEVAYLRFASVYKNFDAASDFQSELELLSKLSAQPTP
jgi:transcriptional repressor NrdR